MFSLFVQTHLTLPNKLRMLCTAEGILFAFPGPRQALRFRMTPRQGSSPTKGRGAIYLPARFCASLRHPAGRGSLEIHTEANPKTYLCEAVLLKRPLASAPQPGGRGWEGLGGHQLSPNTSKGHQEHFKTSLLVAVALLPAHAVFQLTKRLLFRFPGSSREPLQSPPRALQLPQQQAPSERRVATPARQSGRNNDLHWSLAAAHLVTHPAPALGFTDSSKLVRQALGIARRHGAVLFSPLVHSPLRSHGAGNAHKMPGPFNVIMILWDCKQLWRNNHLDLTANPYLFAFHSKAQKGHL